MGMCLGILLGLLLGGSGMILSFEFGIMEPFILHFLSIAFAFWSSGKATPRTKIDRCIIAGGITSLTITMITFLLYFYDRDLFL